MPNGTDNGQITNAPSHANPNADGEGAPPRAAAALAKSVWERLPILLFAFAIAFGSFAYGAAMVRYEIFPYSQINDAMKTLDAAFDEPETLRDVGELKGFSDSPPSSIAADRIEFASGESFGGPILWQGGRWQFMDLCPEWGCLAVEYSAAGEVVHAYPLRPDDLQRAAESFPDASDYPYEFAPDFSFQRDTRAISLSRYENGDLLVIFQYKNDNAFPHGAGVARIDREGYPVWFRRDYSHHWTYLDAGGAALTPGSIIDGGDISIAAGRGVYTLDCGTDSPYRDTINIIGEDGRLLKRINLLDAFVESPHATALLGSVGIDWDGRCDPLHLNYIHRLGPDAAGAWGIAPGDIVASLRNISAFAIIDYETGKLKRLVRGTFHLQHAVHHIEGSTFIMFDNRGADGVHGPSRLLMIDIADGNETTIFPNDRAPEHLKDLYARNRGGMDISSDRHRAIASFTQDGTAVEVRISDGEVLNVFKNLHDVSGQEQFPEERADSAALFRLYGIYYIR